MVWKHVNRLSTKNWVYMDLESKIQEHFWTLWNTNLEKNDDNKLSETLKKRSSFKYGGRGKEFTRNNSGKTKELKRTCKDEVCWKMWWRKDTKAEDHEEERKYMLNDLKDRICYHDMRWAEDKVVWWQLNPWNDLPNRWNTKEKVQHLHQLLGIRRKNPVSNAHDHGEDRWTSKVI